MSVVYYGVLIVLVRFCVIDGACVLYIIVYYIMLVFGCSFNCWLL